MAPITGSYALKAAAIVLIVVVGIPACVAMVVA